MVHLTVNGADLELCDGATATDVVDRWCASPDGVAVALNGDVLPRSSWSDTPLRGGDRVEIVTAAAGG
ncbi:MAG: sulfur carrier protein ThiS [Acidimicrobiales bacterium]